MACPICGGIHTSKTGVCPALGPWAAEQTLASLSPGQILEGKYQIVGEIGRGAMGVEALHVALGRRVAIKTLLAGTGQDPGLVARFEREARAASAIGHPHIVDVFDLGRTPEGVLFMAMELLDGTSLATLLERTPRLPVGLAVDYCSQMLAGLSAAHRNAIVHRDLKPENIFILHTEDRPNFVKIVDFGISKILVHLGTDSRMGSRGVGTAVGTVLGTPLYMSPEQILGQVARIDHRSDIYAAGVVLYEMLCGRTPFEGEDHAKVFASILDGWYPLPRDLRPEIPPSLEAAIVRALDRDMDKRFANAAAMREALPGRAAELTPAPEFVSIPFAALPSATADGRRTDLGLSSGVYLQPEPAAATKPQPGSEVRGDPFAPLPDTTPIPFLSRDLENPLANASPEGGSSLALARPARTRGPGAHTQAAQALPQPAQAGRRWPRLALVLGLVLLGLGALVMVVRRRPVTVPRSPIAQQVQHRVVLAVEPAGALVQIDQVPVVGAELLLDQGKAHVLTASAPGRISRRFSFEVTADRELSVFLGRTLVPPSPVEPGPSPSELGAQPPSNPAPRIEINRAFAKLDRYARCLALLAHVDGEARKGGGPTGPSNSDMSACVQLLEEAKTLPPAMFQLHAAGVSYLQGVQNEQSVATLRKLLAGFRAEFLAVRGAWQNEELARQEMDEGQTAAWHLRKVALAAQSWLRFCKAGSAVKDSRARLAQAHQALLQFAQRSPKAMAQVLGAEAFMKSAQETVALAQGESSKRAEAGRAAGQQLIAAFNLLVVE